MLRRCFVAFVYAWDAATCAAVVSLGGADLVAVVVCVADVGYDAAGAYSVSVKALGIVGLCGRRIFEDVCDVCCAVDTSGTFPHARDSVEEPYVDAAEDPAVEHVVGWMLYLRSCRNECTKPVVASDWVCGSGPDVARIGYHVWSADVVGGCESYCVADCAKD